MYLAASSTANKLVKHVLTVHHALRQNQMNVQNALDWLLAGNTPPEQPAADANPTPTAAEKQEEENQIHVTTLAGKTHSYPWRADMRVVELFELIKSDQGIPWEMMALIFQGTQLSEPYPEEWRYFNDPDTQYREPLSFSSRLEQFEAEKRYCQAFVSWAASAEKTMQDLGKYFRCHCVPTIALHTRILRLTLEHESKPHRNNQRGQDPPGSETARRVCRGPCSCDLRRARRDPRS